MLEIGDLGNWGNLGNTLAFNLTIKLGLFVHKNSHMTSNHSIHFTIIKSHDLTYDKVQSC